MPPDAPPVVTGAYQLQLVTVEIPDLDGGWPVALLRPPGRGPTAFVSLRPTVGRRDDERPEIGMTVVLERRPVPDEPDLSTIAGTGALGLVLSLAPPGSVRSRVQDVAGGPTAPAFARPAEVSVESAGRVLASGRAWGPEPGVSLSLLLDRAEVEDVLAALAGQAGRLDVRVVVDVAPPGIGTRSTRVEQVTGLDLVIGGQLGAEDRARSIHMVCPGRLGQLDAVPPRVATPPATHSGSKEGPVATRSPLALVRQADQVRSLPLVLTPDRASAPDARRLVGSDLARPVFTTSESVRWTLPDVVVQPTTDPPLALPIVDGTDATVFVDRLDPSTRWYTPAFELVLPAADEDPAASPFLFTFMSSGSVLGANGLQIGLRGKLSFTVRTVMKPETRAILAALGNPPASPVPLGNMAIDVEVPFRTQASSQTSTQRFSADVEDNGDGTFGATVEMLDDWVRLAYGSLSVAGFQDIPVRAAVTYAYRSYVPVPPLDPGLGILVGGKINRIDWLHVRRAGQPGPGDPVAAVDLGASTVTFAKEAPAGPATRARPGFVLASSAVLNATATLNATAVLQAPEPPASLFQMQTQVQGESVDVVVPCSTFGGFYRRHDGATDTPVGCQDALRLGETQPRLYEELPAQRSPRWAVWRSLTQPGRFLVVPRTYRITRYGPDEPAERAYRPVAIIHGTIDPDPSRNRYFLSASLQPDMTYAERQQLIRDLAPLSPHDVVPVIEWPTDASVGATCTYRWVLPDGFDPPTAVRTWDALQVGLSADLAHAATLDSLLGGVGVAGAMDAALPDGSVLTSTLELDTSAIGPWDGGAVTATVASTSATLTNRINVAVDVDHVDLVDSSGSVTTQTTGVHLGPGETATVTVPATTTSVIVAYKQGAGPTSLAEADVFIEDITVTVTVVNQVAFANHDLALIEVDVRRHGSETGVQTLDVLDATTTLSATLTLPLDVYLSAQAVDWRLTAHTTGGATAQTGWMVQDLEHQGSVLSLTPELLPAP